MVVAPGAGRARARRGWCAGSRRCRRRSCRRARRGTAAGGRRGRSRAPGQQPVGAGHLHRDLAEPAVPAGPHQLEHRLGAGGLGRESAQPLEPDHLELDGEPGEPVAQHRVVEGAVRPGPGDDAGELALVVDGLGQRGDAALEAEQRHRDLPAVAGLADHEVGGGASAGEEDLVELRAAGELLDRPHLDAVLVERHEQERQPAVAPGARLGARDHEDPLGEVGVRRPHLLAVDHPLALRRGAPSSARWRGRTRRRARSSPAPTAPRPPGSSAGSGPAAPACRRPSAWGRAAPRRGG